MWSPSTSVVTGQELELKLCELVRGTGKADIPGLAVTTKCSLKSVAVLAEEEIEGADGLIRGNSWKRSNSSQAEERRGHDATVGSCVLSHLWAALGMSLPS